MCIRFSWKNFPKIVKSLPNIILYTTALYAIFCSFWEILLKSFRWRQNYMHLLNSINYLQYHYFHIQTLDFFLYAKKSKIISIYLDNMFKIWKNSKIYHRCSELFLVRNQSVLFGTLSNTHIKDMSHKSHSG